MTSQFEALDQVMTEYERSSGRDPRAGHTLVVHPWRAIAMLAELTMAPPDYLVAAVTRGSGDDAILNWRGVPVRMREAVDPNACSVFEDANLPRRTCCDKFSEGMITAWLHAQTQLRRELRAAEGSN